MDTRIPMGAPAPAAANEPETGEEGTELGAIRIHHGVIAVIARIGAMKIPGVVDMSGSFTDGLAGMLGKTPAEKGIRVEIDGQNVMVELHVVIEYGVRIPQVSWKIQNDVSQAIQEMTGKKVTSVDVVIQGVKLPAEIRAEEGGPS